MKIASIVTNILVCLTMMVYSNRLAAEPISLAGAVTAVGAIVGFDIDKQFRADLGSMKQELEKLNSSLEDLVNSFADLPEMINNLLHRANEQQQEKEVIGAIQLMQGAIFSSEKEQLHWLQNLKKESQTLLQNSYFSAPIMVLAMKSEIAFLKELDKETTEAEMRYFKELQRMFNIENSDSLVKMMQLLNMVAGKKATEFEKIFHEIADAYNAPRDISSCPSIVSIPGCYETIITCQLVDIDAVNKLKSLAESIHSDEIKNLQETREFHAKLIENVSKEMPVYFWEGFSENESLIDPRSDQYGKSISDSGNDRLILVIKKVSDYLKRPPPKEKMEITTERKTIC